MNVPDVSGDGREKSAPADQRLRLPVLDELKTVCVPSGEEDGSKSPEKPSVIGSRATDRSNATGTRSSVWRTSSNVATSRRPSGETTGSAYSPMPALTRESRLDRKSRHHRLRSTLSRFAA